jgi:hypothetical protein
LEGNVMEKVEILLGILLILYTCGVVTACLRAVVR